jgi:hypothetical protein
MRVYGIRTGNIICWGPIACMHTPNGIRMCTCIWLTLHFHLALACCMCTCTSILHLHVACALALPSCTCIWLTLHFHLALPSCTSILHLHLINLAYMYWFFRLFWFLQLHMLINIAPIVYAACIGFHLFVIRGKHLTEVFGRRGHRTIVMLTSATGWFVYFVISLPYLFYYCWLLLLTASLAAHNRTTVKAEWSATIGNAVAFCIN